MIHSLIRHIALRLRVIGFFVDKEFRQIRRNRFILPFIFVMPLLQLLILVHAATFDLKEIRLVVVDQDLSQVSMRLTDKFKGSPFFVVIQPGFSSKVAEDFLKNNAADAVLEIPSGFERNLFRENKSDLQLRINAINGTVAGLVNYYSVSVIADFNTELTSKFLSAYLERDAIGCDVEFSKWYNPETDYIIYMFPGILVILVTVIGMFLTALHIVREKETGTIEQINVTPVRKYQFLAGKMIPFWIIGILELAFGLLLGKLFYDIPMEGNILLLFLCGGIYLMVVLGFGLFLATISGNQQQVMFLTWFFMLVFILMSGLFTPADSMPDWAKTINYANPFAYFIRLLRMIMMKGSGFMDVYKDIVSLAVYSILILSLATAFYSKKNV